jgi:hypothetical protein
MFYKTPDLDFEVQIYKIVFKITYCINGGVDPKKINAFFVKIIKLNKQFCE